MLLCVDAWPGGTALGHEEAELFAQHGVTWHFQRVSTASVWDHGSPRLTWQWPCCVERGHVSRYKVWPRVCVCVIWHTKHAVYMRGMWIFVCESIWKDVWGPSAHCEASSWLCGWTGHADLPELRHCPSTFLLFLGSEPHTETPIPLCLSGGQSVCMCVCSASLCPQPVQRVRHQQ